jgi:anthranilate phosphoribosyltransferase
VIASELARLLDLRPLSAAEVRRSFDVLLHPTTDDAGRAALLVALTARPRSVEELVRFAFELRRRARPFPVPRSDRAVDLCGSGGAPVPSFNVSTVGALVTAGAGASVVKHGNRSARGPCGSSDLLEALGLPVTQSVAFARATYRRHRIAFLHAPLYHPATRAVATARRLLGVPTVFNRLGPLSNPARVPFQVVGVASADAAGPVAQALARLGVVRGVAMSSEEGCDEFSPRRPTHIVRWDRGHRTVGRLDPHRLLADDERRGGWGALPPSAAAEETRRLLAGGGGARRGATLLTSGVALWVSGRAPRIADGVALARTALDDGRAERLLEDLEALARRYPDRSE